MKNKDHHYFNHSRIRSYERYGIYLTKTKYFWLTERIQQSDPVYARKIVDQANTKKSVWLLKVDHQWCVVIYSRRRKRIITFLPMGAEFDETTGKPTIKPSLKNATL